MEGAGEICGELSVQVGQGVGSLGISRVASRYLGGFLVIRLLEQLLNLFTHTFEMSGLRMFESSSGGFVKNRAAKQRGGMTYCIIFM